MPWMSVSTFTKPPARWGTDGLSFYSKKAWLGGALLFGLWLLAACGLDPMGGGVDTDVDTDVDRGDPAVSYVYPAADDDIVLLYAGHGGNRINERGEVISAWEDDGWTVELTDEWPSDFEGVRLVLMTNVGNRESGGTFSQTEAELIANALENGIRFVFAQRKDACGSTAVFNLLNYDFDAPINFQGGALEVGAAVVFDSLNAGTQPMGGVSALEMTDPCTINSNTPADEALASNSDGDIVVASFRPGDAGDIVLVGDMLLFSDSSQEHTGNQTFARNLAAVRP
jgi:hypothetical protein